MLFCFVLFLTYSTCVLYYLFAYHNQLQKHFKTPCGHDPNLSLATVMNLPNVSCNVRSDDYLSLYFTALVLVDIVLSAAGSISNILVLFIMSRRNLTKKNASNLFIFHLSVADLHYRALHVVANIIPSVVQEAGNVSSIGCNITMFASFASCAVIFSLLAGIAVDRYRHIIHPLETLARKSHNVKVLILIWFYSLAMSVPVSFSVEPARVSTIYEHVDNQSNNSLNESCHLNTSDITEVCVFRRDNWRSELSFSLYFGVSFLLPLLVMVVSYSKIFVFLRNRARSGFYNKTVLRSKHKALRMLLLVICSFILSWGPLMLINLAMAYGVTLHLPGYTVRRFAQSLSITSSVLIPAIYVFSNSNFRREGIKSFKNCPCCYNFTKLLISKDIRPERRKKAGTQDTYL